MDPFIYAIVIPLFFTLFGYIWGASKKPQHIELQMIVDTVMTNLEQEGYLKTKKIDGELHYVKWPDDKDTF